MKNTLLLMTEIDIFERLCTPKNGIDMETVHEKCHLLQKKIECLLVILGREQLNVQHRLCEVRDRLENLCFHVAVVGEYSTGKSSFLNAILQKEVLPTALEECTAVVTRIRHDDAEGIRIESIDQAGQRQSVAEDALFDVLTFSSAEQTLEEVLIHTPFAGEFEKKVDFVDTPGVNDPSMKGDEVTLKWLPKADAIIFLTHCMQAFKKSEIDFLRTYVSKQDVSRFLFVIHASDLIEQEEDRIAIKNRFLENVGEAFSQSPLFFVSSHQALDGIEENDSELFRASGLPAVQSAIRNIIMQERGDKQLQVFEKQIDLLKEDILQYLQTQLRSVTVEEELREKIVTRKKRSIERAKEEQVVLHENLRVGIQAIQEYMNQQVSQQLEVLRNDLHALSDDDKQVLLRRAQEKTQDHIRSLNRFVQEELRTKIHGLQHDLSRRIFRLLGEIDSDFSDVLPEPIHIDWRDLVAIHTTTEEIERKERDYTLERSSDNATWFGLGTGAMLGAALLGPLGFLAGAAMGGACGNEFSGGYRSFWRTIKEKVQVNRANGSETAKAIQGQMKSSLAYSLKAIHMRMTAEIDVVIHNKLEDVRQRIMQFENQQQEHVQDLVAQELLRQKIQQIHEI